MACSQSVVCTLSRSRACWSCNRAWHRDRRLSYQWHRPNERLDSSDALRTRGATQAADAARVIRPFRPPFAPANMMATISSWVATASWPLRTGNASKMCQPMRLFLSATHVHLSEGTRVRLLCRQWLDIVRCRQRPGGVHQPSPGWPPDCSISSAWAVSTSTSSMKRVMRAAGMPQHSLLSISRELRGMHRPLPWGCPVGNPTERLTVGVRSPEPATVTGSRGNNRSAA